jgi:hypothetical protein
MLLLQIPLRDAESTAHANQRVTAAPEIVKKRRAASGRALVLLIRAER